MLSPDLQRITRIREYCDSIQDDVDHYGQSLETFKSVPRFQRSVSFSLFQIGELARGLSEEFRNATKEKIEWRLIRGMRNIIAHEYGSINLDTLWGTILEDIPDLKRFCDKQLSTDKQL